jgi:hypothetical protein
VFLVIPADAGAVAKRRRAKLIHLKEFKRMDSEPSSERQRARWILNQVQKDKEQDGF